MKAHPGRQRTPPIATTSAIFTRHVLEVKTDNPLSGELREGIRLEWKRLHSLEEIESNIGILR
uniref:Uncharacterized protein n=1 Tax=Candidatus Kentrum sp. FW TaxID=2126338 RepID=A0A450T1K7_9GAMM|nr:MAG: hypothetical protein BECKFW1821B_GA0114236_105419 [Candidatus Kentron sp. FW]